MKHAVLDLRPTQMALGMKEVEHRVNIIRGLKKEELQDYLHVRKVPVVLAPKGRIYLVDRHHLVRACWEASVTEVTTDVIADLSAHSFDDLWAKMKESNWIFPFDQFGGGPHDPIHLPENVRGMADDPYRSLAWMVRDKGGFQKSPQPFAEFHWANYLRKHMRLHPAFDNIHEAITEALHLCRHPQANHLPGFVKP